MSAHEEIQGRFKDLIDKEFGRAEQEKVDPKIRKRLEEANRRGIELRRRRQEEDDTPRHSARSSPCCGAQVVETQQAVLCSSCGGDLG